MHGCIPVTTTTILRIVTPFWAWQHHNQHPQSQIQGCLPLPAKFSTLHKCLEHQRTQFTNSSLEEKNGKPFLWTLCTEWRILILRENTTIVLLSGITFSPVKCTADGSLIYESNTQSSKQLIPEFQQTHVIWVRPFMFIALPFDQAAKEECTYSVTCCNCLWPSVWSFLPQNPSTKKNTIKIRR